MYRLNITFKNSHFFRVEIENLHEAQQVATVLLAKFPAKEGYEIQASYWPQSGYFVSLPNLDALNTA